MRRLAAVVAAELVEQRRDRGVAGQSELALEPVEQMRAPFGEVDDPRRQAARVQRDPHAVRGWLQQLGRDALGQQRKAAVAGDQLPVTVDDDRGVRLVACEDELDGTAHGLHLGVLEGEVQTRESLGKPTAVIIDGRDPANYVIVEEAGLWEGLLEPGATVRAGDPVGRLWFPDAPARSPEVITAPLDGMLAVIRAIPPTEPGDSVFTTGQPIEARKVLDGRAGEARTSSMRRRQATP